MQDEFATWFAFGGLLVLTAGAVGCGEQGSPGERAPASASSPIEISAKEHRRPVEAKLLDANGKSLGTVRFTESEDDEAEGMRGKEAGAAPPVRVDAKLTGLTTGFHGIHIHMNALHQGCVPPTFASVGPHLDVGNPFGHHAGDFPVVLAMNDGDAELSFLTDRFAFADLAGRAVVVHAKPDNFQNVPLGTNADQYSANGPAAFTLTDMTGNAGPRVGCGVIE
jgi:Cu-Zn family superoxide dismutase